MFDAIVLAGGRARRLGGVDKPAEPVGGRPLLALVVAAAAGARRVVVVGPRRRLGPEPAATVVWRREDPPGSGPVAAIAAGLPATAAATVVVLAADLPDIAPAIDRLLAAVAAGAEVALLAEPGGSVNHLAGAWRRDALLAALRAVGNPAGVAVRTLIAAARTSPALVPDTGGWGRDCDTWADLAAARQRHRPEEMTMGNPLEDWVADLCATLGLDPAALDRDLVLDLARDSAHGVARPAAPLTTFLVGLAAGRRGGDASAVTAAADAARELIATRQPTNPS